MVWLWAAVAMAGDDVGEAVKTKLIARDFEGCAAVWALGDEEAVREALLGYTKAARPPALPMRAADCALEKAATDEATFTAVQGWMSDPALPGLALVVVERLGDLPEDKAVVLADLAVARAETDARFARYAPAKLEASPHAKVREAAARIRRP
jgi:hypothetical protein